MADILIPHPERRRALLVVDMQSGFLNEQDNWVIAPIQKLLREGEYSLVVEANFYADENSIWKKQHDWTFALEPTIPEVRSLLPEGTPLIIKSTKSTFKGTPALLPLLREHGIEEVHVVGVDAHDCVLATAHEAFDLGFFSYAIEECIASSEGEEYREHALAILREVEMTNHSPLIQSVQVLT